MFTNTTLRTSRVANLVAKKTNSEQLNLFSFDPSDLSNIANDINILVAKAYRIKILSRMTI